MQVRNSGYRTDRELVKPRRRFTRLRLIYRVPDPFDTLDAYRRFHHLDLEFRSRREIWEERETLRIIVALGDPAHPWHRDRLRRLDEKWERR
jgi:hypothetical protein